jgi:hypothetical protein
VLTLEDAIAVAAPITRCQLAKLGLVINDEHQRGYLISASSASTGPGYPAAKNMLAS